MKKVLLIIMLSLFAVSFANNGIVKEEAMNKHPYHFEIQLSCGHISLSQSWEPVAMEDFWAWVDAEEEMWCEEL